MSKFENDGRKDVALVSFPGQLQMCEKICNLIHEKLQGNMELKCGYAKTQSRDKKEKNDLKLCLFDGIISGSFTKIELEGITSENQRLLMTKILSTNRLFPSPEEWKFAPRFPERKIMNGVGVKWKIGWDYYLKYDDSFKIWFAVKKNGGDFGELWIKEHTIITSSETTELACGNYNQKFYSFPWDKLELFRKSGVFLKSDTDDFSQFISWIWDDLTKKLNNEKTK